MKQSELYIIPFVRQNGRALIECTDHYPDALGHYNKVCKMFVDEYGKQYPGDDVPDFKAQLLGEVSKSKADIQELQVEFRDETSLLFFDINAAREASSSNTGSIMTHSATIKF